MRLHLWYSATFYILITFIICKCTVFRVRTRNVCVCFYMLYKVTFIKVNLVLYVVLSIHFMAVNEGKVGFSILLRVLSTAVVLLIPGTIRVHATALYNDHLYSVFIIYVCVSKHCNLYNAERCTCTRMQPVLYYCTYPVIYVVSLLLTGCDHYTYSIVLVKFTYAVT